MSANIGHVTSSPSVAPTAPNAANPTTAAAVASTHGNAGEANSNTKINSLNDLKNKAPKLYNLMLQGIAMNVCKDMEHHQDRLKEMMREGQRQY